VTSSKDRQIGAYSIGETRLSKQEEEEEEKSNFVEKDFANVQKL
jgi:hypothetical protein